MEMKTTWLSSKYRLRVLQRHEEKYHATWTALELFKTQRGKNRSPQNIPV
jgi:hypothetical protein